MRIDLNADLGEGFGPWKMGDDAAMLRIVTSANLACGGHAGDPETMYRALVEARDRGVAIGAHPGYAVPEETAPARACRREPAGTCRPDQRDPGADNNLWRRPGGKVVNRFDGRTGPSDRGRFECPNQKGIIV